MQLIRKVLYKKHIQCVDYHDAHCIMQDPEYGNENANVAEQGSHITAESVLSNLCHTQTMWLRLHVEGSVVMFGRALQSTHFSLFLLCADKLVNLLSLCPP